MKGFLRKFLVAVSLLSIITIQVEAYNLTPPNVQLLGNANGLVHIPGDDLFLHYPNMLPGDSIKRTLEIKNEYDFPYELFLKAKRVSKEEEEYDLLNKLDLKITYKNNVIYAGPTSGEDKITENISLGIFKPGQEENLIAEVSLDGPSTGNHYKNKYAEVDWIFTAIRHEDSETEDPNIKPPDVKPPTDNGGSSDKVDPPKTGDSGLVKYLLLGGITIILMLILNKKNVKDRG